MSRTARAGVVVAVIAAVTPAAGAGALDAGATAAGTRARGCGRIIERYSAVNRPGTPWFEEEVSAQRTACRSARGLVRTWTWLLTRGEITADEYGYYRHNVLVYGRYGRRYHVDRSTCRTKATPPGRIPIVPSETRCTRAGGVVTWSYRVFATRPR